MQLLSFPPLEIGRVGLDDTKLLLVGGGFLLVSCGKLWEGHICGGGNKEFVFGHVNFDM